MRIKNKVLYLGPGRSFEWLKAMQEDYRIIGRDTELLDDRLIIFAVPRPKPKQEKPVKEKGPRGKRRFDRA